MFSFKSVVILCVFNFAVGIRLETLKNCCDLGSEYAKKDSSCSGYPTPITNVLRDEETNCLNSISACCKNQLKENECQAGISEAKAGGCSAETESEKKWCCDACSLGLSSGSSGQPCQGIGLPYDKHFIACCNEATATKPTTTTLPTKITTVSRNEPLPSIGNMCDIPDLCAQICIPTADSYKCDCNPGYTLMSDGISCKEIKQKATTSRKNNKCEINNPCEHNCVDTGVAIHCTCRDGFQLDKDKRSCKDIDECTLGIHDCMANEICINGKGFYECELLDDESDEEDSLEYEKKCPPGFKFNSDQLCNDIDECQIPLVCEPGRTCVNTIGSFLCQGGEETCPPGFFFKPSTEDCEDIDECITGQDDCNRESQVCLNTKGNFTCIDKASKTMCPPGFKMNPVTQTCEDINECLENPYLCSPDEECVNEPGGHNCISKLPFAKPKPYIPQTTPTVSQTSPTTTPTVRTNPTTKTLPSTTTSTTPSTTTTITTTTNPPTTVHTISTVPPKVYKPPVYPTFDPANPQPPQVLRTSSSEATTRRIPIVMTRPSTKPIPEYVMPKGPKTCTIGYNYSPKIQSCVDINECLEDEQACDSNQDCYNTPGSYGCNCKTGFTMDPTTKACVDINECQVGTNECTDGHRCDNTIGSYLCSRVAGCGTGYTLNAGTDKCEDDNECILGTHTCTLYGKNYVCRNTLGSYRCEKLPAIIYHHRNVYPINQTRFSGTTKKCLAGYYMDNYGNCIDINECQSNPCEKHQKCVNMRGRFECVPKFECKRGYERNEAGDGCVDINECVRGTPCSTTQVCKNFEGFYVCTCPPGHKMVNNECVDINECEIYKDRFCSHNSYCRNTIGSYKCICKEGFKDLGDNKCIDIDECRDDPHLCHQKCVNLWGSYRCTCEPGFTLNNDNRTCTDMDECEEFRDKNLCIGKCENIPGSYVCRCPPGYKLGLDGRGCIDLDECETSPCKGRDAVCVNTRGGYECPSINCPPNYIRDPNHRSRCKRNMNCSPGSCIHFPEQYTYHFITIISNLPIPKDAVKLFQMKGPYWHQSNAQFTLKMEQGRCPKNVRRADLSYFRVNKEAHKADISFIRPIEGPQTVELNFEMQLFTNNQYTGKVIAKIVIYVSEYSF